jgi:S-adenosylmethionine:tRNA ribosyltransferase-isomerase
LETSAFDFALPDELIAQHPAEPRDASRLMVVRRGSGRIEHRAFSELPGLLSAGDVLVRNDTRVVPARLVGQRAATGGKWEGLFLREVHPAAGAGVAQAPLWEVLATTRGKPLADETVEVEGENGEALRLSLVEKGEQGRWLVRPDATGPTPALLARFGRVPLPPYIRKGREGPGDRERYQTLYARVPGAVAAPTAGLHFTAAVFERLAARGVGCVDVTLHVGIGTFRPIEAERVEDHVLHAEWAELSPETAAALNAARGQGGRVVAVGTTSARVLETAAALPDAAPPGPAEVRPFRGETALYLRPGHRFRGLDALLTNFHLPRSSLLVLVSALAGVELTHTAYAEAVRLRYRFYSYGDAMLILE